MSLIEGTRNEIPVAHCLLLNSILENIFVTLQQETAASGEFYKTQPFIHLQWAFFLITFVPSRDECMNYIQAIMLLVRNQKADEAAAL